MATFRVAGPSEYLAITGWGVDDVKLAKKAWVWLGQRCTTLDAAPASYELEAHGITAEKLPVVLRAVCTVGPKINDKKQLGEDPLLPAARRSNRKLVEGVVEGRVRALAAGMTAEEIFTKGAAGFAKEALESAQPDLGKYGLRVYSATVERFSIHVPAPANKVSIVAAAAMGVSLQVGHGATVNWLSKVEVNLSVATKKAGSCDDKQIKVAGVGGVEAHWEHKVTKTKAMSWRMKAAAAISKDEAHWEHKVTKTKAMSWRMEAAAAISKDEASARQQQAAGVQSKMAGEQSKMAGVQSKMAAEQLKMAGEQMKMAVVQMKMAGEQIKMAGVQNCKS